MNAAYRLVLLSLLIAGCSARDDPGDRRFVKLSPSATKVTFSNDLSETAAFNILNYLYYYDGGGVAVGDVNGDELPDLYFTSNEQSNRLYLNRGGFVFEDVTARAGVAGSGNWTTGATMADVNGDGLLDIYVTVVGGYLDRRGRNQLFVNRGDGTFSEEAEAYGLAFEGYGTQAAFFDYDGDGDLDAFLLNHSVHTEGTYDRADLREVPHPRAGDRLYRNDPGPEPGTRRFTDVTARAGIYSGVVGYGLGVAVSDFDRNGCPDVYVANDFHENDYLYLNACDGTFTEAIRRATGHNSRAAMGVDAADVDNDGLTDVVVLDMLPDREDIRKTSEEAEPMEIAAFKQRYGYHHQYVRNVLQLNRGRGPDGHPRFSEIGQLAGIEATDWSWAPLLADFDNDGWKDLFVTTGIYRRPNDLDYVAHLARPEVQSEIRSALDDGSDARVADVVERMPQVRLPNRAFRNDADLTFTDVSAAWGLDDDAFSNGAAYADLDNDGDLDLVVNNVDEPALVYRNETDTLRDHRYLRFRLEGEGGNRFGIGAKITAAHGGARYYVEVNPARGFQSSIDPVPLIGLGTIDTVDTVVVAWPDGRTQTLAHVATNRTLTLRQHLAAHPSGDEPRPPPPAIFSDEPLPPGLDYVHVENAFVDCDREPLLPRLLSTEGPRIAAGDVNGDGLDDLYLGGAKDSPGALFLQRHDGGFTRTAADAFDADRVSEDVDAAFFDADGDGDLDLYVVSGGNEFWGDAEALRHRLYRNDGAGRFARDNHALPAFFSHGSCVAPADFDGDGDVDLFVGGRVVARSYGMLPQSFLLENDGTGRFTDVTADRAPELARIGMTTGATWADVDGDGALDLVVVGEWMPVTVFRQTDGRFENHTDAAGLGATTGWWNTVVGADVDGDGDVDLVAGNLGLNSRIRASADAPARLHLLDLDGNGSIDPILSVFRDGVSYPVAPFEDLVRQVPGLRARYRTFADFGARPTADLLREAAPRPDDVREAVMFASTYFENRGDGLFHLHPLPAEAQFSPTFAILASDLDADARIDLLLAGNLAGVAPLRGRYDASYGLLLPGNGDGTFRPRRPDAARLFRTGDVRALRLLRGADGARMIAAARNDDRLLLLRVRPPARPPAP